MQKTPRARPQGAAAGHGADKGPERRRMRDSGGVGRWATLLPPSMADDWTAIRDTLTHMARADGHTVSELAAIKTRLTVDRFEPDIRALLGEIEVD